MAPILCVTAHPDDESANFGGTVAHYAALGVASHLICLTAGEAARNRGGAADNAALQAMRRQELAAACKIIGFAGHQVWDLPDSALPRAPFYPTVGRIIAEIRRQKPRLVLTMGPEGSATAHPDHAMAGILATAAFHWAAHDLYFPEQNLAPHQAERLFYATVAMQPPRFRPVILPAPDVSISIDRYLETKIEAFRAHHTQAPLFERVEEFLRLAGNRELFHLAAGRPLPEPPQGFAHDLFAGLDN